MQAQPSLSLPLKSCYVLSAIVQVLDEPFLSLEIRTQGKDGNSVEQTVCAHTELPSVNLLTVSGFVYRTVTHY